MPHLGFDPAPGDVGLTTDLARSHYQVAGELRQVLAQVERLDLSPWQGAAGDAVRALQGAFPPALRTMVSSAENLQAAAQSWAGQLSGFQSEADMLERRAASASADQQALRGQQAALPSAPKALSGELQAASATLTAVQRQAQELHERYLAAAQKTARDVGGQSGLWGKTEPVRTVLEGVLAPFDMIAADHWVDVLKGIAGVPAGWVDDVDKRLGTVKNLMREGKSPIQEMIDTGDFIDATGSKIDAWFAFAPGWLKTAAGSLAEIKGLSRTLGGLGILADAGTVISPQDSGALGGVDRGVAAFNGALLAANMAIDPFPVIGEVMITLTGLYLAGDFLYHHWTPFRDVANDVGHATVRAADDAGHAASSAWHSVTSSIGSWF
jgi:hypothetical protein